VFWKYFAIYSVTGKKITNSSINVEKEGLLDGSKFQQLFVTENIF
jgi:hypothetical protein